MPGQKPGIFIPPEKDQTHDRRLDLSRSGRSRRSDLGPSLKAAAVMELGKWFCGVTVGLSLLSMWLLILVMRDLPAGLANGIWTCLGTVGITLGGWLLFKETLTGGQIFFWRSVSRGLRASSSHQHRNVPFSHQYTGRLRDRPFRRHRLGHHFLNNPRLKARGFLTRCRLSRNRQGF
ncbi:MAG: SMR family transporter [Duodenibacillus massiliensis]